MGKFAIITFETSEEAILEKIRSVLSEGHFQEFPLEQHFELLFSGLKINFIEKCVYVKDKPIYLSYYEFYTIYYLANHSGRVFSKKQIYEAVWKADGDYTGAAITNVIGQIRRKLREGGVEQEYIQTITNHGYRFVTDRIE